MGKLNVVRMAQLIYIFSALAIKFPASFFPENDMFILKFTCKKRIAKNNLKREQNWKTHTCQFQNLLQSYSNQDSGTGISVDI
jgi:hypothetical protein